MSPLTSLVLQGPYLYSQGAGLNMFKLVFIVSDVDGIHPTLL